MAYGRHSLSESLLGYKPETAAIPAFNAADYGTAPASTLQVATLFDPPTVTKTGGISRQFTGGTQYSTHRRRDQRFCQISGAVRAGSSALLGYCLQGVTPGNGVYKGLRDVALYTGTTDRNGDGFAELHRFCKAESVTIAAQENGELTYSPSFRSLGFPVEVAATTPTYAALAGTGPPTFGGNPLSWVNIPSADIYSGTELRSYLTGFNIQYNNNLQARNTRNDQGEDVPISRGAIALVPGTVVISGTLNLDARISDSLLAAASTPENWTDAGAFVITMNDTALGGSQSLVLTLADFTITGETQQGGNANGPLTYSIPFQARDLTLS